MMLKVLIADDEPLARRTLRAFLGNAVDVSCVGEARDGAMALEMIRTTSPDVVFLDIQMPALSGIDVAASLRDELIPPAVVFTTAHDQHAIRAFEFGAIDYLLKPFAEPRFASALERARHAAHSRAGPNALSRLESVFSSPERLGLEDRIFARHPTGILPITIRSIEHIRAQDDYIELYTHGRGILMSLRITDMEHRLPNPPFVRVHRSHIVNLDHVDRIAAVDPSHMEVRLVTGDRVPVSRTRAQALRHAAR